MSGSSKAESSDQAEYNTQNLLIYSRGKTYNEFIRIKNETEGIDFKLREETQLAIIAILLEDKHKNLLESLTLRTNKLQNKIKTLEDNIRSLEKLQSSKEKESNADITLLEKNIENLQNLLSQICDIAAISKQPTEQKINIASCVNDTTSKSTPTQGSPIIVNAINISQEVNYPPADSVKYTIISDSTGNTYNQPIEIQLAEDGEASNLNCSADSGRLEICFTPEEKREHKIYENGISAPQHQAEEERTYVTCSEHVAKKQKLVSGRNEVHEIPNCSNNHTIVSELTTLNQSQCSISSNLLKPFNIENNQDNRILNVHNSSKPSKSSPSRNNISLTPPNSSRESLDVSNFIQIGPNGSLISKEIYNLIKWDNPSRATRKLLEAVFNRETLATHSLTGKPSPAFKNQSKPYKKMLDPLKVNDIVHEVMKNCNIKDKEARGYITTKCADENKMFKIQVDKQKLQKERNKQNVND